MQAQEVAIKPNVKVIMKSDSEMLDEVMVVAYGTAKKSAFTGSASTIKAEKIAERTVSNVTNAMAGQVYRLPRITVNRVARPVSVFVVLDLCLPAMLLYML
jgi:hypothetical protein